VRNGNTLRALGLLRQHGLLTQREAAVLEEAYVFWRNVEHRLQLLRDLQTHKLPADPAARRRIARSLGFADAGGPPPVRAEDLFERERARHVARVREVFESLFAKLFQERSGTEGQLSERLLVPEPDLGALAGLLPPFGFAGTRENARELIELGRDRALMTNPARTRRFFASLAPLLLKALAATGDAEGALRRFSRVAGSLGGKAIFYQSLHENPWLLKMTAELAAWSEYLTDILVANPGLFDELVDALRTGQSKPLEQMSEEVRSLASGGDVGDTLRAYRAGEVLRIGVRDLFHQVPLEQTQCELTHLATVLLRAQLGHTRRALAASRGVPKTEDGHEIGFAVLAVGKFGGHELNYGSDLDVLFFYDAEGATPESQVASHQGLQLSA
jgi:glutamate-ammonia-ligase adenylyltransferase